MTTITMSYSVGGDMPIGGILSVCAGTASGNNYLITEVNSASTLTVRKWTWVMEVIRWNPCNKLMELYDYD